MIIHDGYIGLAQLPFFRVCRRKFDVGINFNLNLLVQRDFLTCVVDMITTRACLMIATDTIQVGYSTDKGIRGFVNTAT